MPANTPYPLVILSDAPSATTGLGRIAGDLALHIHSNLGDLVRIATLGYAGPGSCRFPFPQYAIEGMRADWIVSGLPQVWHDFAGNQKGILLSIWDASRLTWFSQPTRSEMLSANPELRNWLNNAPFQRWGYFPIDADGPDGKLSFALTETLRGFDRILAYGSWGEDVIRKSLGKYLRAGAGYLASLPHGIDSDVFFETDRSLCRKLFLRITGAQSLTGITKPLAEDEVLIGIVATNLARKDWALGIQTAALIKKHRKIRIWIHIDILERHWSLPALLVDYGLVDNAIISLGVLSDEKMAEAYSACDLTLGIGSGEGFGYPIFESLFCGTPCVHGNYGGAPLLMANDDLIVEPVAYRHEGLYGSRRPVFTPEDWVKKALPLLDQRVGHPADLDWKNLWPRWENWFRKGLS